MERYATCPASHFYGYVLSVRDLEDRGGADTIDARDRGTLLHGVLEELIREHLPGDGRVPLPPDRAWSRADLGRAAELLDAHAKALTARGLTGREVLWTAQLAKLHRALARTLARDSELRREAGSWPVSVEAAFGRQGADPLLVELPTQGQVPFAGYIDRVDATAGGGLLVVDYKTGRGGSAYERIPRRAKATSDGDLVDGGRRLQLVLYALAARALHGVPGAATESLFWFIETGEFRGGPVTAVQEGQLTAALDVTVGGVRDGIYPVNPGAESWRAGRATWDSCAYCAYDLVCPTSRAEQWNGLRHHVAVRPYADLVDPEVAR